MLRCKGCDTCGIDDCHEGGACPLCGAGEALQRMEWANEALGLRETLRETLRDKFALAALPRVLKGFDFTTRMDLDAQALRHYLACEAWLMADAMLAARDLDLHLTPERLTRVLREANEAQEARLDEAVAAMAEPEEGTP